MRHVAGIDGVPHI